MSRGLEKKEHPGRVRGIGGTVGIKNVFGDVEKRKGRSGVISADELHVITQEIEAKVSQKLRQEMSTMVQEQIANILNTMNLPKEVEISTPLTDHRSSCQSTHPSKLQYANKTQETDPFADLQVNNS